MKTYKLPCTWQMSGTTYIQAESLKEAEATAILGIPSFVGSPVKDSFKLDKESGFYPVDDPFKITRKEFNQKVCEELENLTGVPVDDWHCTGFEMDQFVVCPVPVAVTTDEAVLLYREDDVVGVTTTDWLTKAINAVENLGLTVIEEN